MAGSGSYWVRAYQPDDADALQSFKCVTPNAKHYTKPPQDSIRAVPGVLAKEPYRVNVDVAVDSDGRVIGVIVYGFDEQERPFIFSLGVVRERRNEGIGTRLKRGALAWYAHECGKGVKVYSEVHRNNAVMLSINDKLGVGRLLNPDDRTHFVCIAELDPEEDDP